MRGMGSGGLELQSASMGSPRNEHEELLPATTARSTEFEDADPPTTTEALHEDITPQHKDMDRSLSNGLASSSRHGDELKAHSSQSSKRGEENSVFLIGHQRSASLGPALGSHLPPGKRFEDLDRMQRYWLLARRYYPIAIFTLTASLLYADQNLMAPLLTPIAAQFGFNDEEKDRYLGGYIAALFFAVGAPSAILVGYLCDRMNRRNLLFIVVLLGEGPCLATYFVKHYWQLLLLRVLTGVSVGGTLPLIYSLVGDLIDHNRRAAVAAAIQVATGAGLAAGQAISGFVGPHLGWRWPFVIVAVPAILLATLMLLTTTEPPRGAAESALQEQYKKVEGFEYQEKLDARKLGILLGTPSNLCVIFQGLPGSLPWGVLLTFLNDFLAENQHLSVSNATLIILAWGAGGAVGVIGGGLLGQAIYNRRPSLMPVFVGACVSAATFPIWFLINAKLAGMLLLWPLAAAFAGGMLSSPPGPNARAVLLNVNEPEARGFALGLMTVLDDIGKGAGPFVVSQLIIVFKRRIPAFNLAVGAWIPCGIIFACAGFTLVNDEAKMQERLASKVPHEPVSLSDDLDDQLSLSSTPRLHTYP